MLKQKTLKIAYPTKLILLPLFLIFLLFAPGHWITWSYPFSPFAAVSILRGEISAEIGQDFVGFQRMVQHKDPYTPIDGSIIGSSEGLITTHPPTAFLLTAPLAFLPLKVAVSIWAWCMLAATMVSIKLFGHSWSTAVCVTIASILWMPTAGSIGQLTPFWLLGCACAYHYRNRNPFAAGMFIALASLTKYLPAIFMAIFFLRRKWSAFLGFGLVWISTLVAVFLISPNVIQQMIQSNKTSLVENTLRADNSSLLFRAYEIADWFGILFVLTFLALIFLWNKSEYHNELEITPTLWHIITFLSVALLPITWFYSLFPLLPTVLFLMQKKGWTKIVAWLFLLIPPYFPVINLIILGVGLIVSPMKLDKKFIQSSVA